MSQNLTPAEAQKIAKIIVKGIRLGWKIWHSADADSAMLEGQVAELLLETDHVMRES